VAEKVATAEAEAADVAARMSASLLRADSSEPPSSKTPRAQGAFALPRAPDRVPEPVAFGSIFNASEEGLAFPRPREQSAAGFKQAAAAPMSPRKWGAVVPTEVTDVRKLHMGAGSNLKSPKGTPTGSPRHANVTQVREEAGPCLQVFWDWRSTRRSFPAFQIVVAFKPK
jgi:hypothetical protein